MQVLKDGSQEDPGYIFEEVAEEEAARRGQIVRYPKRNEIFIDIDEYSQIDIFNKRYCDLLAIPNSLFDEIKVIHKQSRSGGHHQHLICSLFKEGHRVQLTDWQRVALQFVLGSDPIKETLSVYRILAEVKNPSILFETEK